MAALRLRPGLDLRVGQAPSSQGVEALDDGDYWMALTFREQRRFGDLKLRRASRTARQFHVRTRAH